MMGQPSRSISMGETIEMIIKHSKGDTIMVSDVGQHQVFQSSTPNLILPVAFTTGGLGTMGFHTIRD
jgi:acetolactate synthase-1/2/3 large subunit